MTYRFVRFTSLCHVLRLTRRKHVTKLTSGEWIGCFGLTEPQGGSDPGNMKTYAKRDGDDWIINGSKMWITNGNIADAAVVWAMTEAPIALVTALRETSILFAVLMGWMLFGERMDAWKIGAVVLILTGVVMLRL